MTYLKAVFIGFGTVLSGCLVAPIVMVIWTVSRASESNGATISYSPMGLERHLAHSLTFWAFILVLFAVGFISSVYLSKR